MFSASDYSIQESEANARARQRVLAYISLGEAEEARLVNYCTANIPRDRYVPPGLMCFEVGGFGESASAHEPLILIYARGPRNQPWSEVEHALLHRHALGQLCDIAGLPRIYLGRLNEGSEANWRRELLAHNLNVLFSKQQFLNRLKKPAEFLHRLVGNEVRAVLTQSYNRHLVSAVVLRPFLEVCNELGLKPAKALITDMRVTLQTYLPYAFEPIPGEFVALGSCWGNSDFGQGKVKVSHTVLRLNGAGNLITEDSFSRLHVGSVVEDTDLRLDDKVAEKELEAVAAAIQSAVREAMKPEQVQKILDGIARAHAEEIPWSKLKDQLGKFLSKEDVGSVEDMLKSKIQDLPAPGFGSDGLPLPSRWWAAAALAHLSERQTDVGKGLEIKQAAGQFLEAP